MGKVVLATRLALRDLRRRPAPALLLLLAIAAAAAVLTLGLALQGVTSQPYQQTRAATSGPDVVAYQTVPGGRPGQLPSPPAQETALTHVPGVTASSGPFPIVDADLRVHGHTAGAVVQGRDEQASAVDQPELTAGRWVRPGGVVIERTFAEALGVGVGDHVRLGGKTFTVGGIAVTAAELPYPNLCYVGANACITLDFPGPITSRDIGLVWTTRANATEIATQSGPAPTRPTVYVVNLKLADPADAPAFANRYGQAAGSGPGGFPDTPAFTTWQQLASGDGLLVQDEQAVLAAGVVLLVLLSVASVAVLAGGRMAEHTRRTGLIKAVGGSPAFVAATLLVENLLLAVAAATVGLVVGWLAAPLFTSPGVNLIGTPGPPSFTLTMVGEVVGLAVLVALVATVVPAVRAARTSTVGALADAARPPRRRAVLIAVSKRLPVPLLLGLRLVARRPRRALLSAASIAVTTTGIVTVLTFRATAGTLGVTMTHGLSDPVVNRDEQMLTAITVVLVGLALLNAICCAWATVLDARGASALSRALGASPRQAAAGVAAAQVIPAVPGVLVGIPLGLGLFAAASHVKTLTFPPAWWLVAAVVGILVVVAALAGIPARIGPRRSVGEILQSEAA